jgi:hypothetical protein
MATCARQASITQSTTVAKSVVALGIAVVTLSSVVVLGYRGEVLC